MMLRASVDETDGPASQLRPIVTGVGETGVPHGRAVVAFTDAVVLRDPVELPPARAALEIVVGREATDRAALVAGNFSMMNRALDAVGAPIGPGAEHIADELGVRIPAHLL